MRRRILAAAAIAVAMLPAGSVAAQTPIVVRPEAPAVGDIIPMSTATYRAMAIMGDAYEIESSQLALARSEDPRVRRFAQRMIVDHTATAQAMIGAGAAFADAGPLGADSVAAPPFPGGAPAGGSAGAAIGTGAGAVAPAQGPATGMAVDERRAALLSELAAVKGRSFDRRYVLQQVMAQEEALILHTIYAQIGEDPALRAFAASLLPSIRSQRAQAIRLERAVSGGRR